MSEGAERWEGSYFNYFTEIEEHFQRARGTSLFLLSPLDWALIESWKNSGVPLGAVLRGIDLAFEKWRARKSKVRQVNSVAYCAQAVLAEAQLMTGLVQPGPKGDVEPPFPITAVRDFLAAHAEQLRGKDDLLFEEIAVSLERLIADLPAQFQDLEELEQRLTALEDKLAAVARLRQSDEELFEQRRELDTQLRPYRGKMTTEQLTMLEKQYLHRRTLERAELPRLSLFYL